jgi:hypothetical protein
MRRRRFPIFMLLLSSKIRFNTSISTGAYWDLLACSRVRVCRSAGLGNSAWVSVRATVRTIASPCRLPVIEYEEEGLWLGIWEKFMNTTDLSASGEVDK